MRRAFLAFLAICLIAFPAWASRSALSETKTSIGLGSVENTALSTWAGTANVTTLGTVTTGTWSATDVALAAGGTNASLTAANGGLVYSTATAMAILAAGSSGQIPRSGGAGAPSWSTATYPATATATGSIFRADGTNWVATTATYPTTTTINQLLYSSAGDTIAGLATANNGILATGGTGIPSIGTDIPTAVTIGTAYIYRVAGTDVALADGGLNASLTASNGGIFYSTGTAGAILAGTATAGRMLRSGLSTAPTWSTATFPATATATGSVLRGDGTNWVGSTATYPDTATATGSILRADGTNWAATTATYPTTTTVNRILYSSATNVVGQITSGAGGVLVTDSGGAPSIIASSANGQIPIANVAGSVAWATITGTANQVTVTNGASTITLATPQDIADVSNVVFNSVRAATMLGGTTASGNLTLKSTSGVGTTDYVRVVVGNNGGTEAFRADTAGNVGIGTTAPTASLEVAYAGTAGPLILRNAASGETQSIIMRSHRGTIAAPSQNLGDGMRMEWQGYDNGTTYRSFGYILGGPDGASPTSTDSRGRIQFFTTPSASVTPLERMRIDNAGIVDIGSQTNTGVFKIFAADNTTGAMVTRINATSANVTTADVFASFSSTEAEVGSIAGTGVSGVIAYNTFTGSHWAAGDKILKRKVKRQRQGKTYDSYDNALEPGTVLVSLDAMSNIEGKTHLPKVAVASKKDDKAVYGVYGGHDDKGRILVLAVGSGIVLATDEGGPIEVGDLLCTSSTPGYASKCAPTAGQNIIGFKARQSLKGKKGKIACTYLAG